MLNKYKWKFSLIILILSISLYKCNEQAEMKLQILTDKSNNFMDYPNKHDTRSDLFILLVQTYKFVLENSNRTIIYDNLIYNDDCFNALHAVFDGDRKSLENVLNNSGKSFSDVGLEDDCTEGYNLTYLFITYKMNITQAVSNELLYNLYNFLEQDKFFVGLCMWKECNNLYKAFLDPNQNQKFFDILKQYGVVNLTLYNMNYGGNVEKRREIAENPRFDFFLTCFWVLVFYISFRVVITFLGYILYGVTQTVNEVNEESMGDSWENSLMSGDMTTPFSQLDLSRKENFLKNKNKSSDLKKGFFYNLTRIMSLRKSMKILFKTSTKYYNESDLKILGGIRFYLFLIITFHQNLKAVTKLPHRDFAGLAFYQSFWFFLGKYSTFGILCYACLDGIYLGYKIMCATKKNKGEFTLKHFITFLFKAVSPFVFFLISFLIFHLYVRELGFSVGNLTIFDFFVNTNINSKRCVQYPGEVFIPFYLQYFSHTCPDDQLPDCFLYVYYLASQLYCYIFLLILFYLLLKIRSKKLDFAVYLLNLVNLVLCYFSYSHSILEKYYTINEIYGEIKTIRYPHLYFIPYFLGINVGIMWFYYRDVTWNHRSNEDDEYNPFFFNFYMMKFFDKCCNKTKLTMIIVSFFIKIAVCQSFYILLKVYVGDEKDYGILIDGNLFIELIFIYEGKFFLLFFLIFVSCILFYTEENSFKKILSSKLFIPMNRISFAFLCSHDFIIYIFYSIYNIQIYLNFINCLFMSLALFVVILIFSFVSVILFELPVRMVYRDICLQLSGKKKKIKLSL